MEGLDESSMSQQGEEVKMFILLYEELERKQGIHETEKVRKGVRECACV